jgi:hypothetical protein
MSGESSHTGRHAGPHTGRGAVRPMECSIATGGRIFCNDRFLSRRFRPGRFAEESHNVEA